MEFRQENLLISPFEEQKEIEVKVGVGSGYIRFRRWRFYAEAGLAKQEVQVSFYTSTLKIEYQETELAFYTLEWEDNKHIKEVKNPRLIETGYRSPQLTLWTLGPDEWLLFLKLPDYAARKKPQRKPDAIQLPLLDPDENQREPRLIMRWLFFLLCRRRAGKFPKRSLLYQMQTCCPSVSVRCVASLNRFTTLESR